MKQAAARLALEREMESEHSARERELLEQQRLVEQGLSTNQYTT